MIKKQATCIVKDVSGLSCLRNPSFLKKRFIHNPMRINPHLIWTFMKEPDDRTQGKSFDP
ncbi:hypothetical protein NC99_11680 [Sunxiuqinia dokdonensis]|uniref:Uncharacterized protein n=1 Tax=Sunxiuqinia dokdonensis TaxID=1409788 RepID=A0A0L8VCE6_9BACT|nr:hypothetical protein NC99_11680 [Sunxiuqinia dokdonensis]